MRNGTRLTLYDLEGNLISGCGTDGANAEFGMFIWSESLNGYFLYGSVWYDDEPLCFWDISATVNNPLGLA